MGFSVLGSLGSHVLARHSCEGIVKFQYFPAMERHNGCFKISKFRCHSGRLVSSKHDPTEFEERASPSKVDPLWNFIIIFVCVCVFFIFIIQYFCILFCECTFIGLCLLTL